MAKNILRSAQKAFTSNYLIGASSIYIFSSFLLKGVNFITTPIFTRIMSQEEYGNVSSAVTLTSFIAIFICCQVASSINTAKVEFEKNKFKAFVHHISTFSIFSAILLGALVLCFSKYITSFVALDQILIIPILLSALGTNFVSIYSSYLIALKKPKKKAIFSIIFSISLVLVSLVAVIIADSKKDYARIIGMSSVEFITFIVVFFLIKRDDRSVFKREEFNDNIKYALAISLPLIFHLLANLINSQADRIFIIRLMDSSNLALYSVAYSLGMIFMAFVDAFFMAWTPWYYEKTTNSEKSKVTSACKITFVAIALLFSIVILLSPELLAIVAPSSYSSAQNCVVAIAFGVFFQAMYKFPTSYEVLKKNTKYVAMATIITGGINIGLNFLLIPPLGIFGAAIATAISYITLFVFHDLVARYIIGGYNISQSIYILPIIIICAASVVSFLYGEVILIRVIALVALCSTFGYYCYKSFKQVKLA